MTVKGHGPTARGTIRKMRNARLGWATALGELIDNSCGNGATTVTVRLTPTFCEIRDDGNGCTDRMFAALHSLDWHEEDPDHPNPTSVYGIGSKDAVIWAGGPTEYYSVRDTARFISIDWDAAGDKWESIYTDPIEGEEAVAQCRKIRLADHGTAIRMPHHTRQINRSSFEQLHKALCAQHWAAIETGIVVRVEFIASGAKRPQGGVLRGKPLPAFHDGKHMDATVSLADGRQIRIVGGVLDSQVRMSDPGFEYIFGHRVVIPCGGVGAGQLSFERVYFRVFLMGDKGDWRVTTNKIGLHDTDEAALSEAVFRECRHLLEAAQSESVASLLERELEQELTELLTGSHRKRAKRIATRDTAGSIKPAASGRIHENAANVQDKPGNIRAPRSANAGQVTLHITEFDDEKAHLLGQAGVKDRLVRLNKRHIAIERAVSNRATVELLLIARSIWADAWITHDDNGNRCGFETRNINFIEKLSAMVADMHSVEQAAT